MKKNGKSKLSPWPYVRNNKRRMASLILSLAAFAVMIYMVCYCIDASCKPFYEVCLNKYDHLNEIAINYGDRINEKIQKEKEQSNGKMSDKEYNRRFWEEAYKEFAKDKEKLKKLDHVDDVLMYKNGYVNYQSIAGNYGHVVYLFESIDDIKTYMNHTDLKIIKGRMPEKRGEIVVDKKIAKNQGDHLLDKLAEGYEVVGYTDTDDYACFGYAVEDENNGWELVLTDKRVSVKSDIEKLGFSVLYAYDYDSAEKDLDTAIGSLENVKYVFTIVTNIVLSLCIIVVLSFHISDRHNEWCLISSIGFSKIEVYVMAFKELLIGFVIALIVGLVSGIGCAYYMDRTVMENLGISIDLFSVDAIVLIISMYILMLALCQIPLFVNLNKITTIDEIE